MNLSSKLILMRSFLIQVVVATILIILVQLHIIPSWNVVIVIGSEFAVAGLRSVAVSDGIEIASSWLDKSKNVLQIITVIVALLYINFSLVYKGNIQRFFKYNTYGTFAIAFIVTIISCIDYFVKNKGVFLNDK